MKTRQISAWILAGVVMSTAFTSCKKSDDVASLPSIGGYNSSNDVSATNLLAHWTFEGTQNELISNTAPTKTYGTVGYTTSLTAGAGQALNVTSGAIVYPTIAKLNTADALGSYTLSMWVNVKNNGKSNGFTSFWGLFPTASTEAFGNLSAGAETGQFAPSATPDTLVLKTNYKSLKADGTFNGQDNRPDPRGKPPVGVFKGAGIWSHFVVRFDPSTHMLQIFANGQSIGAYNDRGVNTVALTMLTPSQAIIGSLAGSEVGFNYGPLPSYTSLGTFAIDNIRVYNKPLSDGDITSLYNLELAGR
ncbi:hypothetical protein BH09BAC4_BH09BAC4_07660 [soil metagenome]